MNAAEQIITTVDLLRHGECEGGDIYRGRIGELLAERQPVSAIRLEL